MPSPDAPDTVPVIDLAPFRLGGAADRARVGRRVDEACRSIGFLSVVGHGVDDRLIADAFAAAGRFFARPAAEKDRCRPTDGRFRGYNGLGDQALSYSLDRESPPDLFERFTLGPFGFGDDPYHAARPDFFPENVWPADDPAFRATLEAYYRAMEALAATLMESFAVGLDLPDAFFADKIDRHVTSLCLNHYPPRPEPPLPGQLRAGEHSDYGSLTIVAPTQGPGGLQVRRPDGRWIDVAPPPGGFVVNIGDLMAQWTNDRWVSTMHRVANPPPERMADSPRTSLIFFHQPNEDAVIEVLPSCTGPGNPAKYAPTTSGAHLMGKLTRQFEMGGTPAG